MSSHLYGQNPRADLGGGCRGCAPLPPSPWDDLRFSNTTGILQKKKTMCFIGVEVEQETSAPPPKKILDPPLESLSGHTVVDTTATPRSVSCRQLYSCSLCSSLRYTNSYSRFLHKFQTIGEIQNRKFKISCTNLGWFAQLWSKHSQFQ